MIPSSGTPKRIAKAMAGALGESARALRVGDVKPQDMQDLGVLIVGSPTSAFKPPKAILGFLDGVPTGGLKGVRVAAFDTRISTSDINSVSWVPWWGGLAMPRSPLPTGS